MLRVSRDSPVFQLRKIFNGAVLHLSDLKMPSTRMCRGLVRSLYQSSYPIRNIHYINITIMTAELIPK